ncbi:MAG: cupin domain-containing protein [Rhodobacteraceae bacterium]|jgi:predicted cupin superfamily sugar epimerase|nr:cupin domain-containing protein [Paracoccaceae bacterium]MBL4556233.1 cupin domain-containing protein [Paracoccaceae bacterium]
MTAAEIARILGLAPHPEGGWYRETWRAAAAGDGARPVGSCIYYLLAAGERSHWHRVDATEIWHFHAGSALRLRLADTARGPARAALLGADLAAGQVPQIVVPADAWQSAEPLGDWTLVGCTVCPGFVFDVFELAPPGFDIPPA